MVNILKRTISEIFKNFILYPIITILVALLVFISIIINYYPIIIFIIACLLPSPYSNILCIICATIVFIQLREKYPNIFWLIQCLPSVGIFFIWLKRFFCYNVTPFS